MVISVALLGRADSQGSALTVIRVFFVILLPPQNIEINESNNGDDGRDQQKQTN